MNETHHEEPNNIYDTSDVKQYISNNIFLFMLHVKKCEFIILLLI